MISPSQILHAKQNKTNVFPYVGINVEKNITLADLQKTKEMARNEKHTQKIEQKKDQALLVLQETNKLKAPESVVKEKTYNQSFKDSLKAVQDKVD